VGHYLKNKERKKKKYFDTLEILKPSKYRSRQRIHWWFALLIPKAKVDTMALTQ
jgi:hypothetical protein